MLEEMETPAVLVADADGVRTITLNRPHRLNAVDLGMIHALDEALGEAQQNDDIRVILLRGAGRAFCAGDDLTAQEAICAGGESALRVQLAPLQRISQSLVLGSKPSVAAIQGWAIGAALSWVLNCDHVVWGEDACGFFPEVSFGTFFTGGATWLMPRLAGRRRANEILYNGSRVTAADACTLNVANQIASTDEVQAIALKVAQSLAALPVASVRALKGLWAEDDAIGFRAALDGETEACVATTLNPETIERMKSAIAKD